MCVDLCVCIRVFERVCLCVSKHSCGRNCQEHWQKKSVFRAKRLNWFFFFTELSAELTWCGFTPCGLFLAMVVGLE